MAMTKQHQCSQLVSDIIMKVAVAVSGGVDSLFTLVLLKEAGFDVLAIHAHFLPPDETSPESLKKLKAACEAVGADFHAVDLSAPFKTNVIAPFLNAYINGLTPNPCAMCNPSMKFGMLFDAANELGADRIATGHYATLEEGEDGVRLKRGADQTKDQSYFLSLVPRERLANAVFPLGDWLKSDVKTEIERRGMAPPVPSESQEICFIPDDDYCAYLESSGARLPGPGAITLPDGTKVGEHKGLWRYTQGQRRGMGVAWTEPLYVVGKNMTANTLLVAPRSETYDSSCIAEQTNVLVPRNQWPETVLAQVRYRQKPQPVHAELTGDELKLEFTQPQSIPAPGQVAVCYDPDGIVLAGGIIK